MNIGLYQAVSALKSSWDTHEVITDNLAKMSIPGYRQQTVAFHVDAPDDTTSSSSANGTIKSVVQSDFSQGNLVKTGDPLNLAIQGQGFFSVKEADGSISYTRNGQFHRSSDGRVITSDGAELQLDGNKSLSVSHVSQLRVSASGTVKTEEGELGTLGIAHFANPSTDLTLNSSSGRFTATSNDKVENGLATGDTVQQGQLEESNGQPITQMLALIQSMRGFESASKLVAAQDSATGQLIEILANKS